MNLLRSWEKGEVGSWRELLKGLDLAESEFIKTARAQARAELEAKGGANLAGERTPPASRVATIRRAK